MKKARIAFIRYHFREPATGIGNVCKNFESELSKFDDIKLIPLTPPAVIQSKNVAVKTFNKILFACWLKIAVPAICLIRNADIYVEMNMLYPVFRFTQFYFFIYDLAFIKFPELVLKNNYNKRLSFLKKINKQKDKSLAISVSTKNDFLEYTDVNEQDVHVVYLDSSLDVHPVNANRVLPERKYFLFVGTLEPRKNVSNLVEAFYNFSRTTNEVFDLYLIGKKGWLYESIFTTMDKDPVLKERIKWIGYASDEDLSFYYRNAYALLYPSIYEGFGLPILEAMKHGLPVITADNSSLGEIGGDAVLYCDIDAESIQKSMHQLYEDDNLRKELIKKGFERVGLFSWKSFGESIHAILTERK